MRALKAFLLAPIPSLLLFIAVTFLPPLAAGEFIGGFLTLRVQVIAVVVFGLIISYATILVFALPTFFALKALKIENAFVTIGCAAAIGAALVILPEFYRVLTISERSTYSSGSGACDEIVENVRTACGYASLAQAALLSAGLGALAGLTFWLVYSNSARFSLRWIASGFAAFAMIFGAAVYATTDRSCHNMFRDGRTSIGPTATLGRRIANTEYETVAEVLNQFARDERLSIRDQRIDGTRPLDFSLCNEEGVNITATDSAFREDGVTFYLYLTNEDAEWKPLWNRFEAAVSRWPQTETPKRQP